MSSSWVGAMAGVYIRQYCGWETYNLMCFLLLLIILFVFIKK